MNGCRPKPELPREDGAAKLAQRYFASHGPATLADFTLVVGAGGRAKPVGLRWRWPRPASRMHCLRAALCGGPSARRYLRSRPASRRSHLLAGFDEYVLGYTDRQAIIDPAHAGKLMTPNGLFRLALLLDGARRRHLRRANKGGLNIGTTPFAPLPRGSAGALRLAAER